MSAVYAIVWTGIFGALAVWLIGSSSTFPTVLGYGSAAMAGLSFMTLMKIWGRF